MLKAAHKVTQPMTPTDAKLCMTCRVVASTTQGTITIRMWIAVPLAYFYSQVFSSGNDHKRALDRYAGFWVTRLCRRMNAAV